MLPRGVTAEQIGTVIEKLRRIPDHARVFDLDEEAVWQRHRVPGDVLGQLYDHGLPNRHGLVDSTDVYNLTLHLGISPAALAARRLWATGLRRAASGADRYEIRYDVSCPVPDHDGDCRYHLVLPDTGEVERVSAPRRRVGESVEVIVESDWPELPAWGREWLDVTRGVEFMRLPETLREDVAFIRETGLGDCVGVSQLLTDEGAALGLPVRRGSGLLLVVPYATPHNWAEVRLEGRWVPVDPVLIDAMIGWGLLDTPEWHRNRSPGVILCRVTLHRRPLVTHNGEPVRATFPTRRLARANPGGA
jgi:hypothetical protein